MSVLGRPAYMRPPAPHHAPVGARPAYFRGQPAPPRMDRIRAAKLLRPALAGSTPEHTPAHVPPGLWAQAMALANKALAPLIHATNASYDRQQGQTEAAIHAATQEYEHAAAGYAPAVASAYHGAEGAQAGSDSALATLLAGHGAQGASDLAARLGPIAGTENPAAVNAIGQGSAAAGYGMGSADLSKLLASGGAAAEYGARLPGLAALTGLQDTKSALMALTQSREDALSKLTSSAPGSAMSLYSTLLGNRQTRQDSAANRSLQLELARESGLVSMANTSTRASTSAANSANALTERIAHDRAMETNAKASITERQTATQDRIAAQKALAQITAGKKAADTKARTGRQRQSAFYATRSKAFSHATSLYKGPATASTSTGPFAGGKKYVRPTYSKAYGLLFNTYAPQLLSEYGFKRATVDQMIRHALRHAGYGSAPSREAPGRTP